MCILVLNLIEFLLFIYLLWNGFFGFIFILFGVRIIYFWPEMVLNLKFICLWPLF